ncbi:MAG: hypothetical protein Q9195_009236 [Heterodermia aff. obscurata]
MGLSCSHLIEARINAMNEDCGRISVANVHSHWRFRKSEFEVTVIEKFYFDAAAITRLLNNSMRDENDENVKVVDRTIFRKSAANDDSDVSEKKLTIDLLKGLKQNAHIERLFSEPQNSVDEDLENVDFININESRKVKDKDRSKNSKNQKIFMTRAKKKAVKSTRRDSFGFEYVETVVQISQDVASQDRERGRSRTDREDREEGEDRAGRGGRESQGGREGRKTSFTLAERLQAFKKKAEANRAKRQQELNQMDKNIRAIEEKNLVIKNSVRSVSSKTQSTFNQVTPSDEMSEQLSDQAENFIVLSSNSDSDYNNDFDDEITENMNMS